jgi:sugar phosphate isomerase/epimerase
MNIGFSLPVAYLVDNAEPISNSIGLADIGLAWLKRQGVNTIEIGSCSSASSDELLRAGQTISRAGLEASLHSYLPAKLEGKRWEDIYPEQRALIDHLGNSQDELMIVLHGYSGDPSADVDTLKASTARALEALIRIRNGECLPIRVSLEITRCQKTKCDPCCDYGGLLEIADQFEASELGLCWDMGHTQSSVAQGFLDAQVPQAFLQRVIHTHIHDMGPTGVTHFPIHSHSATDAMIGSLVGVGYTGRFNLELYPARWPDDADVTLGFQDSIRRLRATVAGHTV